MYRIREVDGHDDEIADTLADLHRLTFLAVLPFPSSIGDIGGSRITTRYRLRSPDSFRQHAHTMRDISVG
jgi:hypothetical protein